MNRRFLLGAAILGAGIVGFRHLPDVRQLRPASPRDIVSRSYHQSFSHSPGNQYVIYQVPADRFFVLTDLQLKDGDVDIFATQDPNVRMPMWRMYGERRFSSFTGLVFGPNQPVVIRQPGYREISYNLIGYLVPVGP